MCYEYDSKNNNFKTSGCLGLRESKDVLFPVNLLFPDVGNLSFQGYKIVLFNV
jgi:hypothetical protein